MFITVKELEIRKLEFDEAFPAQKIDLGPEFRQVGMLHSQGRAELVEEHHGGKKIVQDIRVVGTLNTRLEARCARCLDPVEHPLNSDFDLLYRPLDTTQHVDEVSINEAETEVGYYRGDGILLEDVLKEQVLLSAPLKSLCRDDCKGLCAQCGSNLNVESCDCRPVSIDPRWTALEEIRKKL